MNSAEFQADTPYARFGTLAIDAPVDARRTFIRKTYTHLTAAIYAFVAARVAVLLAGLGRSSALQLLASDAVWPGCWCSAASWS